jgi:hypothetical protein
MKRTLLALIFITLTARSMAQVSVSTSGTTPDPSSMLDIVSTNRG